MVKKWLSAFAAVLLMFSLTACSQSDVTITLGLVVAAADAAVGTLQSTGTIPPGTATLIENYLGDVTTGVEFTTTELASDDTGAVKAAKIAQEFAMITIPVLPPGTASAIGITIQAVAGAVAKFLASIQASVTAEVYTNSPAVESFAAKGKGLKMSSADQKAIGKILVANAKVRAKLHTTKH